MNLTKKNINIGLVGRNQRINRKMLFIKDDIIREQYFSYANFQEFISLAHENIAKQNTLNKLIIKLYPKFIRYFGK